MSESSNPEFERLAKREYQYGFVTEIDEDRVPPGLNEGIVRLISAKKGEPEWLLEWRLKALHRFQELLAENREGFHNLIKLVSAGYTDGFYYKPRIDKDLLAQHARGLIGLSSCLKGEVAEGLSHGQDRKALEAAAAYRDILGAGNFFLEMQWHGIEEQRTVNGALPDDPALINRSPTGDAWFLKLKLSNPAEADSLMDEAAYAAYVETLH